MKNIDTRNKAFIRDDALVLSFDTAEKPFVARFDLDSLVQANFEVNMRDDFYVLTLRDFSGAEQTVGHFKNKVDAHQALHSILQALLSHVRPSDKDGSSVLWRIFKWLLGILLLIALLIFFFMPVPMIGQPGPVLQTAPAAPMASVPPAPTRAPPVAETAPVYQALPPLPAIDPAAQAVPEGQPVDLDALLPPPQPQQQP